MSAWELLRIAEVGGGQRPTGRQAAEERDH